MPQSGFFSGSGDSALSVFAQPRENWNKRYEDMRLRQQYLSLRESREAQQAQQAEIGVQKQIQNVNALKAMPVELPDRPKTEAYINSLINDVVKNVKTNYGDDFAKYLLNEGESAIMQMRDSYVSSGVFAKSNLNKMEMDKARKAIENKEALIGSMDKDGNYVSAEQMITDFQEGRTDGFRFRGAYDASKVKPYEYFGKNYNPGGSKFVPSNVSEQDKLAFAQSSLNAEAGLDYYHKALKGRKIQWKADPIEDLEMFNLDKENKQATIEQKEASAVNSYANAAKLRADAEDKKDPAKGATYFDKQSRQNIGTVSAKGYNPTAPSAATVIKGIGVPVADLATTAVGGKPQITMIKKPNIQGDDFADQVVGLTKGTQKGQVRYNGRLGEIFLLDKGGVNYDLNGIGQVVLSSDPNIYVDQKEDQTSTLENRRPSRAFKKYEVRLNKKEFRKKYPDEPDPGELKSNGMFDDKAYYLVTGYTPIPNWYKYDEVDRNITKGEAGQKVTNELFDTANVQIPTFDD